MEKELNAIKLVAGGILLPMSILILWRGITTVIPLTGMVNGGYFTLGGVLLLLIGGFLLFSGWKGRKQSGNQDEKP